MYDEYFKKKFEFEKDDYTCVASDGTRLLFGHASYSKVSYYPSTNGKRQYKFEIGQHNGGKKSVSVLKIEFAMEQE